MESLMCCKSVQDIIKMTLLLILMFISLSLVSCDSPTDTDIPQKVTVTFNSNGGTPVPTQLLDMNTTAVEPLSPTMEGFEFSGWYAEADLTTPWNFATGVVISDIVLYARWTPLSVTATFDSQGGTAVQNQTTTKGSLLIEPKSPVKEGNIFAGWYNNVTLTTLWNFATMQLTIDITLYAKWVAEESSITVIFESNGGSLVQNQLVDVGGFIIEPKAPSKEGVLFVGWYSDPQLTKMWNFAENVVSLNTTLYAKWAEEETTRTVTFECNGGTAVASQTVEVGMKVTKPTEPTRANHQFSGWYLDSLLSINWDFSIHTVLTDMTLYAKWTPAYMVVFESNGGTAVKTQYVLPGNKVTEPEPITKKGFFFDDWYTTASFEEKWNFAELKPISDTAIYAKWIAPVVVSFESNSGITINTQYVFPDSLVKEPTMKDQERLIFGGWYSDISFTKVWDFATNKATEDVTLYAKWVPKLVVTFESNGGTAVDTQFIYPDSLVYTPSLPIKENFSFEGWYSSSDFSEQWDFNQHRPTSNLTLYAKWRPLGLSGDPMILHYKIRLIDTIALSFQGAVDITIDWGDGQIEYTNKSGMIQHRYTSMGNYDVKLYGSLEHFGDTLFPTNSDSMLFKVSSFGDLNIQSLQHGFAWKKALTTVPEELPSTITDLSGCFSYCSNFHGTIGNWNTENVTNMSSLFSGTNSFNENIGSWNTVNVTDMSKMFYFASAFNQDIGNWNTLNVKSMKEMFYRAEQFNQDINSWNTANVTDMSKMFSSAYIFNQNIDSWNTQNVTDMSEMFCYAKAFNQNINSWNTGNVTNMNAMFFNAHSFNSTIGNWNTESVTDMEAMFSFAYTFNQDISNWNTANVTDMSDMFSVTDSFNQDIGSWDIKNVTTMAGMFNFAKAFNQDISSWDIKFVYDMSEMFAHAKAFNQDISSWDTKYVRDMRRMFLEAYDFNQDLSGWNVESVSSYYQFAAGANSWLPHYKPTFQ